MPGGEQLLFSILLWIALLVILLIPLAMMRLLYKLVCKLVNTWHLEAEGNLFILSAGPLPWLGQNNKFALADISRFENRVLIGGGGGVKTGSSTHSHNLVAIFKNKHTRILMTGFPNEETAKELAEICNSWV